MQTFKKYFLRQYSYETYKHGGIGYADAENILLSEGFSPISFPNYHSFSISAKIGRFLYFFKVLFRVKRNSIVVFLFPVFARMNRFLLAVLLRKKVKLVCYLADIDGIKDDDPEKLAKEISFLQRFHYFIIHNEKMKEWLDATIPGRCSEEIEFFDFLAKTVIKETQRSFEIAFAGNLEKSPFVEKLHLLYDRSLSLFFHIYGPNLASEMMEQKNAAWHGIENPYDLPEKIKGSFGLVWDGDNIDNCSGKDGEYLRYNSQHKLSLYIIAGLPVIIWADAATARLVQRYQIGVTINSLYEIEKKINSISDENYLQMQKNMQPLAEKISTGGCLKEALSKLINQIENKSDA